MQANCWQFRLPSKCDGLIQVTSPDGAHPGLHTKPLDAAIGCMLASHRIVVAATMVNDLSRKHKTNKKLFLAS